MGTPGGLKLVCRRSTIPRLAAPQSRRRCLPVCRPCLTPESAPCADHTLVSRGLPAGTTRLAVFRSAARSPPCSVPGRVHPQSRPTHEHEFNWTRLLCSRMPLLRTGRSDGRGPDACLRFEIAFVDLGQQPSVPMNRACGCCQRDPASTGIAGDSAWARTTGMATTQATSTMSSVPRRVPASPGFPGYATDIDGFDCHPPAPRADEPQLVDQRVDEGHHKTQQQHVRVRHEQGVVVRSRHVDAKPHARDGIGKTAEQKSPIERHDVFPLVPCGRHRCRTMHCRLRTAAGRFCYRCSKRARGKYFPRKLSREGRTGKSGRGQSSQAGGWPCQTTTEFN